MGPSRWLMARSGSQDVQDTQSRRTGRTHAVPSAPWPREAGGRDAASPAGPSLTPGIARFPGAKASDLFRAAGGWVLMLCDEVLNFKNRHRALADQFSAF